jgi:formylglycine-generating enzyme required for sulfatase activity
VEQPPPLSSSAEPVPQPSPVAVTSTLDPSGGADTVPSSDRARDPALALKPGSAVAFKDDLALGGACDACPELVVVPAGTFVMGAGPQDTGLDDWQRSLESPRIKVTIDRPYAVGRFAITFDQWDACYADGGCPVRADDGGMGRGKLPVVNVTWREAVAYAEWLSRKTGRNYQLLSEALREYVTRAGTTTPFWFGTAPSPKLANYLWDRPISVDSMRPNAWGLHHVHGNVSDWTADCWHVSHNGHSATVAPRRDGECNRRVVKGGSWFVVPTLIRSAARSGLNADARYRTVGLRVARELGDRRAP